MLEEHVWQDVWIEMKQERFAKIYELSDYKKFATQTMGKPYCIYVQSSTSIKPVLHWWNEMQYI